MGRPTFGAIASEAGVSLATVERVLNGRGGVKPEKVRRVLESASALGYDRTFPEKHQTISRIEVIIARPETSFFSRLMASFTAAAEALGPTVKLYRTTTNQNAADCVARIKANGIRRSGLIITAPDHPTVRDALIEVQASGIPVIQLVTEVAGFDGDYVGIDHVAAGRSAAMFLSRMCRKRGTVVALAPQSRYEAHKQRLRGFSDYFEAFPNPDLQFSQVMFAPEQGTYGVDLLSEILSSGIALAGFYNCGGLNGSLCTLLREHPSGQDVFFVGHELTDRTAAALTDGTMQIVLDQAPEIQARRSLDLMLFRLGLSTQVVDSSPIRFLTVTAQNLR